MKYFVTGVVIVLLLLQTSCSTQRAISHYSGDGEIVAMPDGGFWQGGGGYEVRFPRVRLDHPDHVTYRFTGLPKVAWRVEVYFAVEGPQKWEWRNEHHPNEAGEQAALIDDLGGTLTMSLKDIEDHVILDVRHKLSEFIWTGRADARWLYDLSKLGFTANPRTQYILEVGIEPDATLKIDDGYVLLRSGGHEGVSIGF